MLKLCHDGVRLGGLIMCSMDICNSQWLTCDNAVLFPCGSTSRSLDKHLY